MNIHEWQKRQRGVFWVLWITYAAFYLGRVNLGIALPGIMAQFGWDKTTVGIIGTALFWAYAVGQLVNGYLGDKLGSRLTLAVGMLASAAMNLFFPLSVSLIMMVAIWAVNGYFQACGWGPTVRVLAHWFSPDERGKMSGRLGTSYILGSAASALLAGFVYNLSHDWRLVFIVPGALMILFATHWLMKVEETPKHAMAKIGASEYAYTDDGHLPLRAVYSNWKVWMVGMALFCANILRYGFLGWAVTYFFEVQGATISTAAYKSIIFPVAGAAGAIVAGWLSDKVSGRAFIAAAFLALAGIGSIIFPITGSWVLGLAILALIGFAVFGAHPLLCAAAPMDFSSRKAVSAATGFIDSLGYVGAGLTAVGTGFLVDRWGWNAGFAFWIVAAFAGSVLMAILGRATKTNE